MSAEDQLPLTGHSTQNPRLSLKECNRDFATVTPSDSILQREDLEAAPLMARAFLPMAEKRIFRT
jgi:hypothetical protein